MRPVIEIRQLHKDYHMGSQTVHALRGVDLAINEGEFVAIMGASGSGKSTLMNIIGCLDEITSGTYILDGSDVGSLKPDEYADIRNQKIGFVFQSFNLLPRTSALENVELPLLYDRSHRIGNPKKKALECLDMVGLSDRAHHEPNQLSGGQQQRVAIARSLVNDPAIILADEPTGNLDSRTSVDVMRLFQDLNDKGITIVLVTHESDIAQYTKRKVVLLDGHITRDEEVKNRLNAVDVLQKLQEEDDEVA